MERNWLQISCQRDVSKTNFERGVQDFNFSVGGRYGFVPSKSYFRVELKLQSKDDGGSLFPPTRKDNLALADNVVSNLYNNCYFKAGGADVSSIVNYSAHAHQVKTRLSKSKAWLDSMGKSAYFHDPDFQSRVNTTSSDGEQGGEVKRYQKLGSDPSLTVTIQNTGLVDTTLTQLTKPEYEIKVGDVLDMGGIPYYVTTAPSADSGAGVMAVKPIPTVAVVGSSVDTQVIKTYTPKTDRANSLYVQWQPPIGIFDTVGVLGSGTYRIQLNPNANYKKACVEALTDLSLSAQDNSYDIEVADVQLFVCIEKANIPSTGVEKLYLTEMQVQSKTLASTGTNLLDFTVPPSTKAITVFMQSSKAGSDNVIPLTKFRTKDDNDLNMQAIQITYANVSKPSTNFTSEYIGQKNFLTQRYLDSQISSGLANSVGGPESFRDWVKRGPIYHFDFERDAEDRSTHVQLNLQTLNVEEGTNVFIVSHYSKVCEISTTNGMISNVVSLAI